jgi:hypothetical protein
MDSTVEIWAAGAWQRVRERLDAQADEIIGRLRA